MVHSDALKGFQLWTTGHCSYWGTSPNPYLHGGVGLCLASKGGLEIGTAAGTAEGGRVSWRGFQERKKGKRLNEAKALRFRGKSPQGRVLTSNVMSV